MASSKKPVCQYDVTVDEAKAPCGKKLATGQSYCEEHTWAHRKDRAEQRLRLARQASGNEAESAAMAACALMHEHSLVFYPESALVMRQLTAYRAASGDAQRKAALHVAKASAGAVVVRDVERRAAERAPARAPAAVERATRVTASDVMGFARDAARFVRDAAMGMETRDGRTVADSAERMRKSMDSLDHEVRRFRDMFASGAPPRASRRGTKTSKSSPAKKTRTKRRTRTGGHR